MNGLSGSSFNIENTVTHLPRYLAKLYTPTIVCGCLGMYGCSVIKGNPYTLPANSCDSCTVAT